VFDLAHLSGNAHWRAFQDIRSVIGMIEQHLAAGQQVSHPEALSADVTQ
jgi:hypothetical protein